VKEVRQPEKIRRSEQGGFSFSYRVVEQFLQIDERFARYRDRRVTVQRSYRVHERHESESDGLVGLN
jgi:hypothetical protein